MSQENEKPDAKAEIASMLKELEKPAKPKSPLEIARELIGDRHFDEALLAIEGNLAKTPFHPEFLFLRGHVRMKLNDLEGARTDIDHAIAISVEPVAEYHSNRAVLHLRAGRIRAALVDLDKVLELSPDDAAALRNRGFAHQELGDHTRALEDYDRACTVQPANPQNFRARGWARYVLGNFLGAAEDYVRCRQFGQVDADLFNGLGMCYFGLGNAGAAVDAYTLALKLRDDEVFYCNRAEAYIEVGRPVDALKDADAALLKKDDYGSAWLQRGRAAIKLGSPGLAREAWQKATDLGNEQAPLLLAQHTVDPDAELASGEPSCSEEPVVVQGPVIEE